MTRWKKLITESQLRQVHNTLIQWISWSCQTHPRFNPKSGIRRISTTGCFTTFLEYAFASNLNSCNRTLSSVEPPNSFCLTPLNRVSSCKHCLCRKWPPYIHRPAHPHWIWTLCSSTLLTFSPLFYFDCPGSSWTSQKREHVNIPVSMSSTFFS